MIIIRSSSSSSRRAAQLFRSATHPKKFSYIEQLTNYLKNNVIVHEPDITSFQLFIPGRFIIIPKPYGISCVGVRQQQSGVFEDSVFDRKDSDTESLKNIADDCVTISDCIPGLSRLFSEPNLSFCTGLKSKLVSERFIIFFCFLFYRYLSGAIVLPANKIDFENMKKSIQHVTGKPANCPYHYRSLAILISSPPTTLGTISGYATFQSNGHQSEYIFVEKYAKKRARTGKFAVAGSMDWRVLVERNGCSLVEFGVNKFARHLPRVMFSHMLCPILGDEIYGNRLIEIDGKPATVQPKDLRRVQHQRYFPPAVPQLLGVSQPDLIKAMPIYCHVYSTIFPRFGWILGRPKGQQDVADLYANAPPPPHFLAMVEALGMNKALMEFFHDDEEAKIIAGDKKF
ncbi:hypothetical protein DICVIV_01511 [Dictyocaulus viviparus]|uniref:Uncharacterized protein n=1 Tax=Dictyocaulus viviparus TaxID=29172 RepID=A0A0D8Y8K8_DICVI|nr:hypothetical protein DICVIV_01511 [Dictyocaulus viviparus]